MAQRFTFKNYYVTLKDDGTGTAQRGEASWKFTYDKKTGATEVVSFTGYDPTMSQIVVTHIQTRVRDGGTKAHDGRRRIKF